MGFERGCKSRGREYLFGCESSTASNFSPMPRSRLERETSGLGNRCSIQLSYRGEGKKLPCRALIAKKSKSGRMSGQTALMSRRPILCVMADRFIIASVPNLYDFLYASGIAFSAPVWLLIPRARRKVMDALRTRTGETCKASGRVNVMIHAVSVGEINAAGALIDRLLESSLARSETSRILLSTTTKTGLDRAKQLYGRNSRVDVIRFPLDFSKSIARVLDVARPGVVVLMELEVWPNFMKQCEKRQIPVIIANGRITAPSSSKYRWLGPVSKRMFSRVTACLAQDEIHASRFIALGVPGDRVSVAGTMKFDSAPMATVVEGADQLYTDLAIDPLLEPVFVCGSTGPGEEAMCIDAWTSCRVEHPDVRLLLVPRKPERFGEVGRLIEASGLRLTRRTNNRPARPSDVILLDTMGELRKAYAHAAVVFVGRSLVDLGPKQHGSDMIEAAALGKPVITGPFTGNFDEPMRLLLKHDAVVQTADLKVVLQQLLGDFDGAKAMGIRAARVVRENRGATQKHVKLIEELLRQNSATEHV